MGWVIKAGCKLQVKKQDEQGQSADADYDVSDKASTREMVNVPETTMHAPL